MIRHCVMFRWKPEAPATIVATVSDALAKLPDLIPGIVAYSFGPDIGVNQGNDDFVVVADFATVDDYVVYRDHPEHKKAVTELIAPNIAERHAVQFEFAG
jgi:hypothetical protein